MCWAVLVQTKMQFCFLASLMAIYKGPSRLINRGICYLPPPAISDCSLYHVLASYSHTETNVFYLKTKGGNLKCIVKSITRFYSQLFGIKMRSIFTVGFPLLSVYLCQNMSNLLSRGKIIGDLCFSLLFSPQSGCLWKAGFTSPLPASH